MTYADDVTEQHVIDGAILGALLAETLDTHPELVREAVAHLERNAKHGGPAHYAQAADRLKTWLAIYQEGQE